MNCKKYGIEVTGCSYLPGARNPPICDLCLRKCGQMVNPEKTIVKTHSTIAKIMPTMVKTMPILETGGDLGWKRRG